MLQAVRESLPIALGIVLATMPLLAVPLTLLSRGAIGVLGWFLAGYAAGFVVLAGGVIVTADLFAFATGDISHAMPWLRIVLGVALLALAWRKWQGRPARGEEPAPPGWVRLLDTLASPGAVGLGFALVVLNPKNAVLVISGALTIAAATPVPAAQALGLMVFTIVSGLGVAAPLVCWLVFGERVSAPLNRLRGFLVRHDAHILTAVLAGLGLAVMLRAAAHL